MLELRNITKTYKTGDTVVNALSDVGISFRKSEFVSILGQSGSGKTTLLNIIGGLDQYTDGDLIINGTSTKLYKDRDWDNYRNHSIGFVFQSYNLIPHQTVLSNVELALTLSGISKSERKKRAQEVLTRVGLGDQVDKKPNQMSGGQMQRVAIARALINDPDILLADEPTGALDSETSVQVMELLKEVSKDRLVIMVTHNPELAEQYSSRIVRLLDGHIVSDSMPYSPAEEENVQEKEAPAEEKTVKKSKKKKAKTSMSFFTALSLSFNNLLTKKTRTVLTSFAGSIGIIGIALILSVSTGFQQYIDRVQEDTLSSYPITIQAQSVDLSSLITAMSDADKEEKAQHERDAVYENKMIFELMNAMNSAEITTNNLTDFKKFIETDSEIKKYLSSCQYEYDLDFNIYTVDETGAVIDSDIMKFLQTLTGGQPEQQSSAASSPLMGQSTSSYSVWQEMLPGPNGELICDTLKDQYEFVDGGRWPEAADEIVLIVDKNNEVSDLILYSLGLKTQQEILQSIVAGQNGEIVDTTSESWTYEEIKNRPFKLILNTEKYVKNGDGTYSDITEKQSGIDYLYNNNNAGINLKIVGIVRQNEEAVTGMMRSGIGYTTALTKYAIDKINESEIVKSQLDNRDVNVITGLPFKPDDFTEKEDAEKIAEVKEKIASMSAQDKAAIYKSIKSVLSDEEVEKTVSAQLSALDREKLEPMILAGAAEQYDFLSEEDLEKFIKAMTDEELFALAAESLSEVVRQQYAEGILKSLAAVPDEQLAAMFDMEAFTDEQYLSIYDSYLPDEYSEQSFLEVVYNSLGYVSEDHPSTIYLYAVSFEQKDKVADCITRYNKGVANEDDKITYTDYVKLLMSSITVIIKAITIVLTGFVSISLVVSSIMIGIITYISVLERTKEIGILRAVGASKKDVSRVFNAETLIVGFVAGLMGILITLILIIPLNMILFHFTGIAALKAVLPWGGAVALVLISMFLTFIAGLIPASIASKKNPVEALRSE